MQAARPRPRRVRPRRPARAHSPTPTPVALLGRLRPGGLGRRAGPGEAEQRAEEETLRRDHSVLRRKTASSPTPSLAAGQQARDSITFAADADVSLPTNTTSFASHSPLYAPSRISFTALAAHGYGEGYSAGTRGPRRRGRGTTSGPRDRR